ncbi:hypothetical protein BJB45_08560 [Halomonas huangheensis]|uniref:Uncharacterized protein n=1 Tax=Halomonas huangheensis TaxID=1178482 RepID=W1NCD6_9GAMM|nr:hypothetical protein BJB45_08560 [Halomonas huangheensis]
MWMISGYFLRGIGGLMKCLEGTIKSHRASLFQLVAA